MPIRGRRKTAALVAAFAVALGTGLVFAFGLMAGWFDAGSIKGTREGFDEKAIDRGDPTAEAWAEYGRTPERTRANVDLALPPPYRTLWRVDAGTLLEFPPVIARGRAIVGTNGGRALAVEVSTGKVAWRKRLRGAVASSPALVGVPGSPRPGGVPPTVLFTTMKGDLIALSFSHGHELWRLRLGSAIETSPLVIGSSAYIGTRDGRVLRVDLRTRKPRWTVKVDGEVKGSLARNGADVVVGDYGGRVSSLRTSDGSARWRITSPGEPLRGAGRFYAGPAVAYGRVFIGNVNGRVLGLSARTGRVNWVRVVGDYVYSSAAVADDTVYVGSYDHNLYALDAVTGSVRWKTDVGERVSGSPTVVGRLVWVATLGKNPRDGRTLALDAATGARRFTLPDGRYSTAVGIKGRLVLTGVKTLYGLTPAR